MNPVPTYVQRKRARQEEIRTLREQGRLAAQQGKSLASFVGGVLDRIHWQAGYEQYLLEQRDQETP